MERLEVKGDLTTCKCESSALINKLCNNYTVHNVRMESFIKETILLLTRHILTEFFKSTILRINMNKHRVKRWFSRQNSQYLWWSSSAAKLCMHGTETTDKHPDKEMMWSCDQGVMHHGPVIILGLSMLNGWVMGLMVGDYMLGLFWDYNVCRSRINWEFHWNNRIGVG